MGIAAYFGLCEFSGGFEDYKTGTPGDYGWKVLTSADPEEKTKKLAAEIANGRLAMVAIIGLFFQDGLTGSAWGDWSTYTASPLRAFESELGVQEPVGFWDPLGFTADGDVASFKRRRSVELKHGRICMLATMGYITPEITGKLPGYLSPSAGLKFADIPNGLAAVSKVPTLRWAQIAAYFGFCEFSGGFEDYKTGPPGDYGFKVLTSADPAEKTKKLAAEINNGRLAMVAIIGMFFQDGLTGSAWGDWALYTASPLRAQAAPDLSKELGACPPLGFWDPLGLSKYTDPKVAELQFRRRRVIEIQHGRVSMLACIGYIVPEFNKWPGYCSPSQGIEFQDIPNGLAACAKIPLAGWLQIVAFVGTIEVSNLQSIPGEFAGDYEGYGAFGLPRGPSIADKERKQRSLLAEINNGRLAMVAIIGLFFQDGLTGSAWGDWANYTASPLR